MARDENSNIFPYRLDKIKGINNDINKNFNNDFKIDIDKFLSNIWGMDFGKSDEVEVIFFNHGNVINKAKKRLIGKGTINYDLNNNLIFKGKINGIFSFFSWIRGFGSSVKIVSPEWLRQKHIDSEKKILKNYENMSYFKELIKVN